MMWFFGLDHKEFGASLFYHFSQSLDIFAQENVKSATVTVRGVLERQGFSVFDGRRDACPGQGDCIVLMECGILTCLLSYFTETADWIFYLVKSCHRLIIFLTPEFIKDDWSFFFFSQVRINERYAIK